MITATHELLPTRAESAPVARTTEAHRVRSDRSGHTRWEFRGDDHGSSTLAAVAHRQGATLRKRIAEPSPRVLIVDDEPHISELLTRILAAEGYACVSALNGEAALRLLEQDAFDLLLVDVIMPGMSGMDLLTVVGSLFPSVAVILVTGVDDRDTAVMALDLGAYGYLIKPFNRTEVVISAASALERNRLLQLAAQNERYLEAVIEQRTRDLVKREEEIVLRLVSALGQRDGETGAHAQRVGLYSEILARDLGWNEVQRSRIRRAAVLHDLGKIAVPDHILRKPGPLTPEELTVVKTHAEIGAQLLDGSEVPVLRMAREIALTHHERWDGSGYPQGLTGEAIPQSGRIVAVADVYDSLTRTRVYRPAMSEDKALSVMIIGNTVFDPQVFDAFLRAAPEFRRIREDIRGD
jgi:putative two-component system response regulator